MGPNPRILLLISTGAVLASGADRRRSFAELAADSDKVVLGTVTSRSSSWGDADHIYTDILITPDVTIKGADEGPVAVRVLGGTVGDTVMSVSDGPEFPEGERLIVFLQREGGRFAVTGRAAGSVRAASAEGAAAAESAFDAVEKTAGRRFTYQRGLASRYLGGTTARAQTGCYGTDGAKWAVDSASYRLGSTIPAEWSAGIDAAAATWSGTGAAFRLVRDDASTNELSFEDLVAKYGGSYSSTLAVTTTWTSRTSGVISKATVAFNTKYGWSTSGESGKEDVQNIITHEFGHWMRLLDIYSPSTCSDVTMWGSAAYGETKKRTLEQADLDGLLSLYPAAGGAALSAPVLVSPGNGATGIATAVKLVWNQAPNATSYDVYFGASPSPGYAGTVGFTDSQTGGLTVGTTYYWRVVAKNGSGSASSGTWSFSVGSATQPAAAGPKLLSPADGATDVPTRATFVWSAVDGATYDFYLGTSASALAQLGTVQGTSATVRGLSRGTVYFWKVVARTTSGTASSAVASFTTR
jgi:hypothetical protein